MKLSTPIFFVSEQLLLIMFYSTLVNDSDGLKQLMTIAKSQKKYTSKTLRCTHHLLTALWRFSSLRDVYRSQGYKESDFLSKTMTPK